ncbi:hypothetical protein GF327_03760 [Candidatus Woesearchaeota archaeon]|nr:hypothetical protein [Candidatus Woesearchaeota archaeon]
MRKNFFLTGIVMFFLIPVAHSLGSISTSDLTPRNVDLCGENSQYVTISAQEILNLENETLTSVKASLYLNEDAGLSYVTPQTVELGDIYADNYSSVSPSWVLQCLSPNQGIYTAFINYTSANSYFASSIDQANTVITVYAQDDINGNITIIEKDSEPKQPSTDIISDNTPTVVASTDRDSICRGAVDADKSYDIMDFVFYGTERDHNYTFTNIISEGKHTIYVKCKDLFGKVMENSMEISFQVDSSDPEIIIESPLTISKDYINFHITVSEESECRYSFSEESFNSKIGFDNREKISFSSLLEDLKKGENPIYVECRDIVGNTGKKNIIVSVERPPSCEIILSDESPVKQGILEVKLIPSKKLREIPDLSYSYTDTEKFTREISLTEHSGYYKGFLIIDNYETPKIGVFEFSGYDLSGNKGTEITNGADFIVDTIKPGGIESINSGTDPENNIVLKWFYEGEGTQNFNIYRSTTPGVTYIDYYDKANIQEYTDENLKSGTEYYYRVCAVDKAGNIGELSKEVSAVAQTGLSDEKIHQEDPPRLSTLQEFNKTLREIESLKIDIDWAEANLAEQKSQEPAVTDLGLYKNVMGSQEKIKQLKNKFEKTNPLSNSDQELKELIANTEKQLENLRKQTPAKLEIIKKTEYMQPVAKSDIDQAVREVTKGLNFTEKQLKEYREKNYDIREKIRISSLVKTLSIEYLDESGDYRVWVNKNVHYEDPEPVSDIKLVEIIPKTLAGNLGTVNVRTADHVIINEDPVIAWNIDELSYEKFNIKYIVITQDTSESAKNTKTIGLLKFDDMLMQSPSLITGFSTTLTRISPFNIIQTIGVFIGIMLVISLFMYYLAAIKEIDIGGRYLDRIKNFRKEQRQQIKPVSMRNYSLLTSPEQYFYLANGDVIRSLGEFFNMLEEMGDSIFYTHVNEHKNDFSNWLRSVFRLDDVAEKIQYSKSKKEMIKILEQYKR